MRQTYNTKAEVIKLRCECGTDFERPKKFIKYEKQPHDIVFKWKLRYCDRCFTERVKKASKRLPEIIDMLLEDD